ncbi:MAG TPA: LysR family transcriptional regulator [Blastocatellia bacterium]|nr:LysR family transcriptional regulator [Blastocatellia bacterium]
MNLQSIDLNLLLVFEALMEERNVTRAARRVGLSQPAMSNALTRLRRTFDDPLLIRTPGAMTPTHAAQALIEPVRNALGQLRIALEAKPSFDPAASKRAFHLLANDYVEIILLARLVGKLRKQADGVSIRVHRPPNVFQPPSRTALSDSYDLAIGFFPDALSLDASVRSELLFEEENVCIASAKHPSIRGKISLRQFASEGHVAVFYKSEGPGVIDTILSQKGLTRKLAVLAPHFASVPFIVAESNLIATVPKRLAIKLRGTLKLQLLPLPIALPALRLSMLWHERMDADPAHTWLRRSVAQAATQDGSA